MAALEAGIAASAATIGTAANLAATNNLNRRNRRWQEAMWNKANEYNLPSAQKQRLIDAGINPYSVMAASGSDTGNTSQSPAPPQFDYKPVDIGQHEILSNLSVAKDIQLKNIDIEKGNADMEFYRIKQLNEIQKIQMEISEMLSSKKLNDADRDLAEKNLEILEAQKQSLISKSKSESDSARVYADNLQRQLDDQHLASVISGRLAESNIDVNRKTIDKLVSDIVTNVKFQSYYDSLIRLNDQQVYNLVDEISNNVRKRVSSRFHDQLDERKVELEIVTSVLNSYMEANKRKFGIAGEFRTTQGKVIKALKRKFPELVNDDFFDRLLYSIDEGYQGSNYHGGGLR